MSRETKEGVYTSVIKPDSYHRKEDDENATGEYFIEYSEWFTSPGHFIKENGIDYQVYPGNVKPYVKEVKDVIRVEHWEGIDEYIITVNGKPTGGTLTMRSAEPIKEWLDCAIADGLRDKLK